MRTCWIVIAVFAFTVVPASKAGDDKQKALKQLAGTWDVIKSEPKKWDPERLIFDGDKLTLTDKAGKEKKETKVKVDPKAKPAHLDVEIRDQVWVPGLYEVTEDTLRICLYFPRLQSDLSKRPTAFKASQTEDGDVTYVITLKRVKK